MTKKFVLFDSDSLKKFHKRIFFSILIFIFFFSTAIYRISNIMIFSETQFSNKQNIYNEKRGRIFDKNGTLLAVSINSYSLSLNPLKIKNKSKLIKKLSKILNLDKEILIKKLSKEKKFVWIKRNISPKEHQKIIDLGEIHLRIHNENKRIYPYQNVASHIVGYVNIDENGQAGIERSFNEKLIESKDVHLTIDINLQQSVRDKLKETIELYRAESGLALIMDISNGNLLSSVSYPDFNPNDNLTFNDKNLINRVFQSNYEMGSTFKPLTVAMGFDKGIIDPKMTFNVKKKIKGIGDYNNYKGDGIYNVKKIIIESSNIGTAKIASLIGKKNQIDFFKKIGFYDKVDIEILESAKPLGNKNHWGDVETMTIGYGHGFAVTPLHLAKAYGTIANNGNEVKPTIVRNNKNNKKNNLIVKEKTSKYFLHLLKSVVTETEFTGPRVKIDGYNLGGKTGTAILINKEGGYYNDRDLTSFISIFPINEPKYLVLTVVEYPKKIKGSNQKTTGAVVNAPLVKNIILEMIKILKIPKFESENILNADINKFYKKYYVSL